MKLDRRSLLIGGGAGVGLIVAFSLWPRHWRSELSVGRGEQAFGSMYDTQMAQRMAQGIGGRIARPTSA